MELGAATLRIWIGRPKEEFCGNAGASTSVLRGRRVAVPPLVSSPPPVPSAAITYSTLPTAAGCCCWCCCCRDAGRIRLCIGIAWWVGLAVASKEGLVCCCCCCCCCTVLMVISCECGGRTWGRVGGGGGGGGEEQDLRLTTSVSVLMTCTRGGGEEEVMDERERRNWRVFSMGEWIVAGGEGLTRFMVDVVMGSLLCSKVDVVMTCSGWWWVWWCWCCWWWPGVDPLVSCEGTWEMRRIGGPPAIVWIMLIGAWVWPLLREMPFAVIGMKLAGLFGAIMLTGVPPLVGRTAAPDGVWLNVGWLLLPACTKLTAPPIWPGVVVNIRFWPAGRATICPWLWPGREVNIFVGAQMLTGLLCSLGLVTAVPRHICFGDGSSGPSGFKLRFRWFTAKGEKKLGNK